MKILFMGTPDFALFSLKALASTEHEIVGVITQPDKPRGRGYTLTPPPVKVFALEAGFPVYQPETLRSEEFASLLTELSPDVIVVVAYGKILPKNVLDFPKYGCINVHGSLLPEYRGAAPMQRAIIDGKSQTGITTMYMAEGLDTGDMLLKDYVDITDTDNFETIHDKLGECGAALIVKTLEGVEAGTIEREPQDDTLATYAAKINKEDCVLDFSKDARTLHNLIRGVSPFPLAFTHTPDGKLLKITSAEVFKENGNYGKAGEVIGLDGGILVACKNGALNITGVLPEGKPRMKASDFVRGRKINVGDILA
ncbi:MAG: methionyl-tRNA formyltransferase [Ruminococcaceae bacterium]|nr:methionyl-tRNA formyltransferase [Oscillospiraceae bacterium]